MIRNINNETVCFQYRFRFGKGIEKIFNVSLNGETLNLVQTTRDSYPGWTELTFMKCQNCSLDEAEHLLCPIAANLVELVDFFQDMISYKEVELMIQTEQRSYYRNAALQQGISSLVGIYMVTSGCPIMEKLKPMVRYHLPFASLKETQYRVLSMYLLAQYFRHRQGKEPDWDLKNLVRIYDDVQTVNKYFCRRLASIHIEDATLNALVKLDMFAKHVSASINKDVLDELERLFDVYLK